MNSNKFLLNNINIYDFSKNYLIKKGELKDIDNIIWDKNIENGKFKCTVDNKNEVNVIVQSSFDLNIELTKKTISECFSLFDNNNYPIIIIENFNKGGYGIISQYLSSHVNLNIPYFNYMSYRYNDDVKINVASKFKSREIETCKLKYGNYFFNDYKNDYYGKIQHKRTIISNDIEIYRIDIFDIREKMKNIRKPTDIIIFTDGFSFSATSFFIKSTQLLGGAIIVGYGGNPQFESFDSSQSPSAVINTDDMNDELSKEIQKLNFVLYYTFKEYFSDIDYPNVLNIPLEYKINLIDERIHFYDQYYDDYYDYFINEGLKIYDKYKTQCNKYNKKLILNSNECTFEKKELHGGYECGDNWIWNYSKCVPSYCDNGFIFDEKNNDCIKDICIDVEKKSRFFKILGIVFIIIGIISLIVFICLCYDAGYGKGAIVVSFVIAVIFIIAGIVLIIIKDN